MANEPIEPAAPAAAPAPVAPAASEPAPASASAAEPAPITTFLDGAPELTEAPAAEPVAPAAEPTAPVEPAAPAEPAKAPEPEKPATEEKPSEAKKDEGDKSAEPAPLPVFEPWKLPEEIQLDEQLSGEFNKLLGEFQTTTKAEQAAVQKFGQDLVDRHITALNQTIERVHEAYTTSWQKQTDGWREAFINDPEIGGKRQETTLKHANEFIDTHGGTAEQKAAFRAVMKQTGLGVHPEVIRLLSNAMHNFREGRPLPAPQPRATLSRTQRMYGAKTG